MSTLTEKGFKGTIYFYKSTKYNNMYPSTWGHDGSEEAILLGQCDVDVEFADSRAAEIEALKRQVEIEKQESHNRVQLILGRIQNLQALENKP